MYWFINDHLGTPQKIVSSSAQVVWAAAYLPFGKAQVKPNTIENNLRFPGQYSDAESGLHYNWNRYYDPDTGRYLTPDPIGLAGGVNLYVYVMGNPINYSDANGLFWGKVGGAISIVGGTVVTVIGIGITAVAAGEAHTVILIPFIPHTVGAGTTIIGAGLTTALFQLKLLEYCRLNLRLEPIAHTNLKEMMHYYISGIRSMESGY